MTPKKKPKRAQGVGTSEKTPQRATRTSWTSNNARNRGNSPHPLGLTNPDHITRYNDLSSRVLTAVRYFNAGLLSQLGLMNDI